MPKRKIVKIDEDRCNGCGLCIPVCKEGALQIVDGKARLASDIYCDGLGACLGECPRGAITIEEREADEFDEEAVKKHLQKDAAPMPCGCPGMMAKSIGKEPRTLSTFADQESELRNWPLQLHLVPANAPYLKGADIVFMADCTGFSYPNLHRDFIRNRIVVIACPKLDNTDAYLQKLTEMIRLNNFRSIEAVMMEVPCCSGLGRLVETAVKDAGSHLLLKKSIITIEGKVKK